MKRLLCTLLLFAAVTFAGEKEFDSGAMRMKLPAGFTIDKSKPGNYTGTFTLIDLYTEELKQDWDLNSNGWVTTSKEITMIDTAAGTVTTIEQDTLEGQLVNADKYILYAEIRPADTVFKINKTEIYSWSGSEWVMQGRTVYTYDANEYLISITTEFQLAPGMFLAVMRSTYTNNTAGHPELMISESYNMVSGQWTNTRKTEFIYLKGNPNYLRTEYDYDWENEAWVPYYQTEYTRNDQLNITEVVFMDYFNGSYENISRMVYDYQADGMTIDSLYYDVWMNSSWTPSSLSVYTYTASGDDDVIYFKEWMNGSWEELSKISYTYDDQGRETVSLTEIYENNAYRNGYRELTSYAVTSVKEETSPASFTLKNNYPNPFNPSTTIEYEVMNAGMVTLTVYNVLGQVVAVLQNGYQQAGVYTVQFDGTGLTSGVYLYELAAGSTKITKKMILNK